MMVLASSADIQSATAKPVSACDRNKELLTDQIIDGG
jgi:hypothetical protein